MTPPRPFRFDLDHAHTSVTAYLSGDLDITVLGLAERIIECIDEKTTRVVLDASELNYCYSTGLRQFVTIAARAREVGAEISLYQPSQLVAEVMRVTGLDEVIPVRVPRKN